MIRIPTFVFLLLQIDHGNSMRSLHQRGTTSRSGFSDRKVHQGPKSHQRLSAQYENRIFPQRSVYGWIEKFKNDSSCYTCDRRVTTDEVAHRLQINLASAYEIMHNKLGFHKVCTIWIPKQLIVLHKQTRMGIYQMYLNRYTNKRDNFLDRIITDDKTWMHHYGLESKQKSVKWKHPQSV